MKAKQIVYLPLKSVVPDANQPRTYFDATKLATLANSIKRIGIKEPLNVEKLKDGTFRIIDGERRYRAAKMAGLTEVPAIVEEELSEQDRLIQQFHLQEQHEGWRPQEKAVAIRDLANTMQLTMKEIGVLLGISKDVINQYISFINLVAYKEMVKTETPIAFATRLNNTTKHAVKMMLEQKQVDMSLDEQKAFQVGVMKRIKSGEITRPAHLTKIYDSLTVNAPDTVKNIIKTNKTVELLFVESHAKSAYVYRSIKNDLYRITRALNEFAKYPELTAVLESDETFKKSISATIKKLQNLPI